MAQEMHVASSSQLRRQIVGRKFWLAVAEHERANTLLGPHMLAECCEGIERAAGGRAGSQGGRKKKIRRVELKVF
jgi:hypothetical protein